MQRTLLGETAVLDQFSEIVRGVSAEIAAPSGYLANVILSSPMWDNIRACIVDGACLPIDEFELGDIEEIAVKALD